MERAASVYVMLLRQPVVKIHFPCSSSALCLSLKLRNDNVGIRAWDVERHKKYSRFYEASSRKTANSDCLLDTEACSLATESIAKYFMICNNAYVSL